MFKKLDKMLERFDKLNQLVSDSEVIAKMDEWRAYTKELSDITETVEKYTEYKKVIKEQEELKELVVIESDREMKALMEEEIETCKDKLAKISEELRILLLPKDPNDDKNVIVEIRAGAGGEEAFHYIRFGLKTRVWDNFYLHASAKTHLHICEYVEFGLGYQIPFYKKGSRPEGKSNIFHYHKNWWK